MELSVFASKLFNYFVSNDADYFIYFPQLIKFYKLETFSSSKTSQSSIIKESPL